MKRVLILGAAGRDFHNFNVVFRHHPEFEVVAFTATQIPDIAGRRYPAELAGPSYPDGIPILDEKEMEKIVREKEVDIADRKSTRLNSSHIQKSRMPSSA